MKTPYIIILVIIIAVGGYMVIRITDNTDRTDTTDVTNEERVWGPEDVTLSVGQSKDVAGLAITLNTVSDDSRCPADVQCVWAGAVTANVTLADGEQSITSNITSNTAGVVFAGRTITILEVTPTPRANVPIAQKDYSVKLHIEATASGSNI